MTYTDFGSGEETITMPDEIERATVPDDYAKHGYSPQTGSNTPQPVQQPGPQQGGQGEQQGETGDSGGSSGSGSDSNR